MLFTNPKYRVFNAKHAAAFYDKAYLLYHVGIIVMLKKTR